MKFYFLSLAIGLSAFATSARALPEYLKATKGVLLTGLTSSESFEFTPGKLGTCDTKVLQDFVRYLCEVTDKPTLTTTGSSARKFEFDKLTVFDKTWKKESWREYIFSGYWTGTARGFKISSRTTLFLKASRDEMKNMHGDLTLTDYGVASGIQAISE